MTAARPPQPAIDVDAHIDPHMRAAIDGLGDASPLLLGMARYHLGWVDRDLGPLPDGAVDRGKRFRPLIALLSSAACGGQPGRAVPLATAIELLHNFTLVHDDIQDRSPTRRHRETVWSIWGDAQAINAGDALFAAAHIALYRLRESEVSPELVLNLAVAFDHMTAEIVAGQVLDLTFESRNDVSGDEYTHMIAGKTAAIVRYAAWAGALIGGASDETARRFGEFGRALGLGFQVRDDLLGIWGAAAKTGKAEADDIRRKKQSLPILLLRAAADDAARAELAEQYAVEEIDANGVCQVLALLDRFGIRDEVERAASHYHIEARGALDAVSTAEPRFAQLELARMVDALAVRSR